MTQDHTKMTDEADNKKNRILIPVLAVAVILLAGVSAAFAFLYFNAAGSAAAKGDTSDEMKLPYTYNYNDDGASSVERMGDHMDSPYFCNLDFYNAESTDSLTILPKFRTIQQTSWWSCGVCAVMMALDYYDALGDWNEASLAELRSDHSGQHKGTCLDQIIEMLNGAGAFELETTYDYAENLDAIDGEWLRSRIAAGYPVIVGWNDWGGHWQVIIGYDTMGTEDYIGDDVIIVADSYDTTDHNQNGYGVYGMERFMSTFDFYNFFPEDHQRAKCFVVVKPVEKK